jgi:hypothetical protein
MVLELDEICGADPEEENQPHDGTQQNNGTQLDLKPEFCQYQDEGCRHAPSCLDCPFPHCFYEQKRGNQHWRKNIRNEKILRLHAAGKSVKQLAARFKLTERMIERIVKEKTSGKKELE